MCGIGYIFNSNGLTIFIINMNMYNDRFYTGARVTGSGFGQDSTHQAPYESSYVPNVSFPFNQ